MTITVTGTNDLPVASDASAGTDEDTCCPATCRCRRIWTARIAANGYALVANVAEGSLTLQHDGSYSFDPGSAFDDLAPGATRDVSFTYTATDNTAA